MCEFYLCSHIIVFMFALYRLSLLVLFAHYWYCSHNIAYLKVVRTLFKVPFFGYVRTLLFWFYPIMCELFAHYSFFFHFKNNNVRTCPYSHNIACFSDIVRTVADNVRTMGYVRTLCSHIIVFLRVIMCECSHFVHFGVFVRTLCSHNMTTL